MKLFIDTWGFLALADSRESFHKQVKKFYRKFHRERGKAITSDYVLDETMTRLFSKAPFPLAERFVSGVFASIQAGFIGLERVTEERFQSAWDLRRKLDDKPDISFTDLTSMVIMKESGITDILTYDKHFRTVYGEFRRALFDR